MDDALHDVFPARAVQMQAVAAARALIARRAEEGRHHVACALLTRSGRMHLGLNMECLLGRAGVCAEAVALGVAFIHDRLDEVVFCAAVNRRLKVIPPCGLCRELMMDHAPRVWAAVPVGDGDDFRATPLLELAPHAYKAALRGGGAFLSPQPGAETPPIRHIP